MTKFYHLLHPTRAFSTPVTPSRGEKLEHGRVRFRPPQRNEPRFLITEIQRTGPCSLRARQGVAWGVHQPERSPTMRVCLTDPHTAVGVGLLHLPTQPGTGLVRACPTFGPGVARRVDHGFGPAHAFCVIPRNDVAHDE